MASITLDGLTAAIDETNAMVNNMVKEKYVQGDEQTFSDVIERICTIVMTKGKALGYKTDQLDDVVTMLRGGYFLPAGSILAGLTTNANKKSSLSNCYVMKMENDSIESIFKILGEMARTYSYRGGCGVDITVLRPQGTTVHNAAKTSSGAVSFMPLFSSVTETIGQNGRRGAMMLTMDVRHPDIMRYIWCKADPARVFQNDFLNKNSSQKKILPLVTALQTLVSESKPDNKDQLNHFISRITEECHSGKLPAIDGANISVKFTDEFMEAVKNDQPWECIFPDIEADKELYNREWDGDYAHWEAIGGKLKKYDTYEAYVTRDNEFYFVGHHLQFGDQFILIQNVAQLHQLIQQHHNGANPCRVLAKIPSAKQIFMDACTAAWLRGDPGALFWDQVTGWTTINQNDPKLRLVCTNPCSEIPSYAGGSCLLGAHVISKYVDNPWTKDATFNDDLWMQNCNAATVVMNIFSDLNETMHPLQQQRDLEHYAKRIGIEFTGLADTLSMLGLKYGNHANTIEFIEGIMRSKAMIEIGTSLELAKQFTVCDYYKQHPNAVEELIASPYLQHLYGETHPMYHEIREVGGLRNVAFNTVGPTGSLSILANNCSSGIEPVFAMFYTRRTRVGDKQEYLACHAPVARHLVEVIKAGKVDRRKLTKKFVKEMYNVVEAHELGFEDRIAIQQACQKYCDSSISSTVNLPTDCKPEDIMNIYLYAHEQELKGITIYRDGSLTGVLSAIETAEEPTDDHQNVVEESASTLDLQSTGSQSTTEEMTTGPEDYGLLPWSGTVLKYGEKIYLDPKGPHWENNQVFLTFAEFGPTLEHKTILWCDESYFNGMYEMHVDAKLKSFGQGSFGFKITDSKHGLLNFKLNVTDTGVIFEISKIEDSTNVDIPVDESSFALPFSDHMVFEHGQWVTVESADFVGDNQLAQSFLRFVATKPALNNGTNLFSEIKDFHTYSCVLFNPELKNHKGNYQFTLPCYNRNIVIVLNLHVREHRITLLAEAIATLNAGEQKETQKIPSKKLDKLFSGSLFVNYDEEILFESTGEFRESHTPFLALVKKNPVMCVRGGKAYHLFTGIKQEDTATICSISHDLKMVGQKNSYYVNIPEEDRHFLAEISTPGEHGLSLSIQEITSELPSPDELTVTKEADKKAEEAPAAPTQKPAAHSAPKQKEEKEMTLALKWGEIIEMPKKTLAERHEVYWNGCKMYIVVSMNEKNRPMEIFISSLPRKVSTANDIFDHADYQEKLSLWTALMRMISVGLRAGVDVCIIISQLRKAAFTVNDMMSVIARVLETYAQEGQTETSSAWGDDTTDDDLPVSSIQCGICPQCGEKALRHEGGCACCHSCGYSKCS